MCNIIKKNGEIVKYNFKFIETAVEAAAEECRGISYDVGQDKIISEEIYDNMSHMSDSEWNILELSLNALVKEADAHGEPIPTSQVHEWVIQSLSLRSKDVADAYAAFHKNKSEYRKALELAADAQETYSNRDNANVDSSLASSVRILAAEGFEKLASTRIFLSPEDIKSAEEGFLYFHDQAALKTYPYNCCLVRFSDMLENTIHINGTAYPRPDSILAAGRKGSAVIFGIASNQYGGCTAPQVDLALAPYVRDEYEKEKESLLESMGRSDEKATWFANQLAMEHCRKQLMELFTQWEVIFNSLGSSRGDYPFITITGGVCQPDNPLSPFAKMVWECAMEVRKNGHGEPGKKKPMLFPKLVFLYDENLHGEDGPLHDLFLRGVQCSSVTMYPDWLSLTGEGYVASMYKQYGKIVSPMGCRAFLSPWYEHGGMYPADENDVPVFEGRFNLGVVSLNLPLMYLYAQEHNLDFFRFLDFQLQLVRKHFKRRIKKLGALPAGRNRLMFCEGGAYDPVTNGPARLKEDEPIWKLLRAATCSFGVTALGELQQAYNHHSLVEDGAFALKVMEFINKRVDEFKKEDHILYAIYGTPAESLCGKQVKQIRKKYGIVNGVSDREYVSNSFHCHVAEDITPIQKQDLENRFWDYFNGGKIQYVRYPLQYNEKAIITLVTRAMEMGFYEGVNLDLNFCENCGQRFGGVEENLPESCPSCGSKNITSINRMNGYMGYSRMGKADAGKDYDSGKNSRFNEAKNAEFRERRSM